MMVRVSIWDLRKSPAKSRFSATTQSTVFTKSAGFMLAVFAVLAHLGNQGWLSQGYLMYGLGNRGAVATAKLCNLSVG
jgi:hypothetical protein